jgi:hypothetical protein
MAEHPSMPIRRLQCEINGHFTGPVHSTDPLVCLVCGSEIVDESVQRYGGDRVLDSELV